MTVFYMYSRWHFSLVTLENLEPTVRDYMARRKPLKCCYSSPVLTLHALDGFHKEQSNV